MPSAKLRLDELLVGKRTVPSRAYVSWFNFKGGQQQRPHLFGRGVVGQAEVEVAAYPLQRRAVMLGS